MSIPIVKRVGILLGTIAVIGCGEPIDNPCGGAQPDYVMMGVDYDPVWSPDGSTIAYMHSATSIEEQKNGPGQIWLIDSDGENSRFFINGIMVDWSPDGKWLVYYAGGIFKLKTDGDSLAQLAPGYSNSSPSWSPDGKWIAYFNYDCDSLPGLPPFDPCGLMVMTSSGLEKRRIGITNGQTLDWSPDGKYLIYVAPDNDIYRVSISDSTDVVRLTSLNQARYDDNFIYPQYSPDGTNISFASDGIWTMNSDGSNLLQITSYGRWHPSWSSDGTQIVYNIDTGPAPCVWERDNLREKGEGVLWIMDADGTNHRQLTFIPDGYFPNSRY